MPVTSGTSGRVRAEDVLAHVEGGVNEMSDEAVVENAALAEQHEELLRAHGYRLVRVCFCCACVAVVCLFASIISSHSLCTGCTAVRCSLGHMAWPATLKCRPDRLLEDHTVRIHGHRPSLRVE